MHNADQPEVIEFLETPAAYGVPGVLVQRIDTHGSVVFLAGDRAYKMKRAVGFEYMDFSTLARRKSCCEAEVRLNHRGAPGLYLRALAVTREDDGGLALAGAGAPIEWLVEMIRFDQDTLFDHLAASGGLTPDLIDSAAEMIAAYLDGATVHREAGSADTLPEIVEETARMLAAGAGTVFKSADIDALMQQSRAEAARLGRFLDQRRRDGWVRRGHGDLHLRNLCLYQGKPALFDAIEFNDRLAIVDVLYDLAFLLMDLLRRGLRSAANQILNRHLEHGRDYDSVGALPLFLSSRAAIRAHVAVPAAKAQLDPTAAQSIRAEAREYLALAASFLAPPPPKLVAIGGLSGTGKSVQARALAPHLGADPGAVILRSDVRRKALMGVAPTDRLGPEGYSNEVTRAVYDGIRRDAERVLSAGHSVILDAVYARPQERADVKALAKRLAVPFTGVWLRAPVHVLETRVNRRVNDASDADAKIVAAQSAYDLGPMEWTEVDADGSPSDTTEKIRATTKF